MKRPLILHQLNAVDVAPVEFIKLAAANDCEQVTLFACEGGAVLPESNRGLVYPTTVTPQMKRDVLKALADNGVSVNGVEFFPLTAEVDLEDYVPSLALGSELGAKRAVSHVLDDDDTRAVDKLGALCDLASAEGLMLSIEFCPLLRGCPTLERAIWLVDQVGRPNLGIGVDVLHTIRSGSSAADVAKLDAHYFGVGQICDAHGLHTSSDYINEVHNREIPGAGDLPIHEVMSAIPASTPIEVEVPAAKRRESGVSAAQHVRDVVSRARPIVDALTPSR